MNFRKRSRGSIDSIGTIEKQQRTIRLLTGLNGLLIVACLLGASSKSESEPVSEIIFTGKDDTHWRIATRANALCFETKTKNHASEDKREWHRVAQLYADQIHGRHAVRFDVGDFADQKDRDERYFGVASMGIETNRMLSSPYFSVHPGLAWV